jgi:hypothetical protein
MGIMGSFLDSNFSLGVVTQSPGITKRRTKCQPAPTSLRPEQSSNLPEFYADFTAWNILC